MRECEVYYNTDPTTIYTHDEDNDWVSKMIHRKREFYEQGLLGFINTKYHDQANILDIGANIGNHSLFFAKYLAYDHLYSFEPMRENIEIFKRNLAPYTDKSTLFEFALGDKEEELTLYNQYDKNYGGISLVRDEHKVNAVGTTRVVTLDSLHLENISLIKLDVEMFEVEVLKGGKQTIQKYTPTIILENNHYYFSHIHTDPEPHKDIMEELGYTKIYANVHQSSMDVWCAASAKEE